MNWLQVLHQVLSLHQIRIRRRENKKSFKGFYHIFSDYYFLYLDSFLSDFNVKNVLGAVLNSSLQYHLYFQIALLQLETLIVIMAPFLCSGVHWIAKSAVKEWGLFVNGRWWNFSSFSWVMEFYPSGALWRALLLFLMNVKLRRWVTGWAVSVGSKQCHPPFLAPAEHSQWVRESTRGVHPQSSPSPASATLSAQSMNKLIINLHTAIILLLFLLPAPRVRVFLPSCGQTTLGKLSLLGALSSIPGNRRGT